MKKETIRDSSSAGIPAKSINADLPVTAKRRGR